MRTCKWLSGPNLFYFIAPNIGLMRCFNLPACPAAVVAWLGGLAFAASAVVGPLIARGYCCYPW